MTLMPFNDFGQSCFVFQDYLHNKITLIPLKEKKSLNFNMNAFLFFYFLRIVK